MSAAYCDKPFFQDRSNQNYCCVAHREAHRVARWRASQKLKAQRKGGKRLALVKRGKTWHCHFVVNGQRFRQSLETKDWREAQAKQKQLISEASEGKLAHNSTALARLPLTLAADEYVSARKLELAPASRAKKNSSWCNCGPTSNRSLSRASP